MEEFLLCPSLLCTHNSFLGQKLGTRAVLASKMCELTLEAALKIFLVGWFSPSFAWLQTPLSQFFSKKFLTFLTPNRLTRMLF